jgi:drug/metabolite transporter (DMT)-like permease
MKNDTKMTLLMLMATVFWAGAFITGKMGVYALSPLVLTFLRMFFSAVIIFPIMVLTEKDNWRIELSSVKYAVLTAGVGMIGYHMFFFKGFNDQCYQSLAHSFDGCYFSR